MVPTIKGVGRPLLKVVPNADLPKLFEEGWTFKASLGDGQSIVEAQARGREDGEVDFLRFTPTGSKVGRRRP